MVATSTSAPSTILLIGTAFNYLNILFAAALRGVGNTRLAFFVALALNALKQEDPFVRKRLRQIAVSARSAAERPPSPRSEEPGSVHDRSRRPRDF